MNGRGAAALVILLWRSIAAAGETLDYEPIGHIAVFRPAGVPSRRRAAADG